MTPAEAPGYATKEEVRARIDIVDLISEYVTLKKAGQNYKGLCPFHAEKTPSFNVRRDLGFWKCFGCGESGDVFDFLMRRENLTFPEALERLADRAGVRLVRPPEAMRRAGQRQTLYEANRRASEHFQRNLRELPEAEHARRYLAGRGFDEPVQKAFGIGFARESWDDLLRTLTRAGLNAATLAAAGLLVPREGGTGYYDRFRNRITFPIFDTSGRTLGFGGRALADSEAAKYINSPETPVFRKGSLVYGLNWAREAVAKVGFVVVCEGYTDVVALRCVGVENVVATLGTSLTGDHVALLSRYAAEVVLAYDADSAGMQAALRNADAFEGAAAAVKVAVLPPGLDPDDLARERGAAGFDEVLQQRRSLVEYQLELIFGLPAAGQGRPDDSEALARTMTQAASALARIRHEGRRAEAVRRVCERLFRNRTQAEAVQSAVLSEARRLQRRQRYRQTPPSRAAAPDPEPLSIAAETVARSAADVPPGCLEVEGALLAAAVSHREIAQVLRRLLPATDYLLPDDRRVADAIYECLEDEGEWGAAQRVNALPDETARRRGIELSMMEVGDPDAIRESLEADIGKLKKHARSHGEPELFTNIPLEKLARLSGRTMSREAYESLEKDICAALTSGELGADDPRYEEWRRIQREAHGAGELEFWQPR
jgi:DNA primase